MNKTMGQNFSFYFFHNFEYCTFCLKPLIFQVIKMIGIYDWRYAQLDWLFKQLIGLNVYSWFEAWEKKINQSHCMNTGHRHETGQPNIVLMIQNIQA